MNKLQVDYNKTLPISQDPSATPLLLTGDEKKLWKKFIAQISEKGSDVTSGEIWKIAATFTGNPRILPDNLFKAIYNFSKLRKEDHNEKK